MKLKNILSSTLLAIIIGVSCMGCEQKRQPVAPVPIDDDSEHTEQIEDDDDERIEVVDYEPEDYEPEAYEPKTRYVSCTLCYGSGSCGGCGGGGVVYSAFNGGEFIDCSVCNGSGRCQLCDGTGQREEYIGW